MLSGIASLLTDTDCQICIDCHFSIQTKKREILFQTNLIEKYLIAFQTLFFLIFLLENFFKNKKN